MTATSEMLAGLREAFAVQRTRPYEWRRNQLLRLKSMIDENEPALLEALHADLAKSGFEGRMTETGPVLTELAHALAHLKKWMRPRKVSTPLVNQPGHSRIVAEPLGVVLIIAPWNYPFNLLITPLIGAISAGNCAVLKPSELSPATSAVLARLIPSYLDTDAFRVVEGGVETAIDLLDHRFDHIFFTGSEGVGKSVMTAAARHLTPVTLELGGKSPCIVDGTCDLDVAARRITWAKFLNAGQTCIAPDYILVDETITEDLVARMKTSIRAFFGEDPRMSDDYPRMINARHFDRVRGLMRDGTIATGGSVDEASRYIAPTILTDVDPRSEIMNQEIFGPLLPVLTWKSIDEAVAFVNARPKPLALYLFSNSRDVRDTVLGQTSSGSACVNDAVMQISIPDLPFGGVGTSGMGAYHGRASFDTFSHAKSILTKTEWPDPPLRYPPFTKAKLRILKWFQ
ncbi:aldehyde dehydrogenase family protein [uncultured Hoeflea sp.]|uniref:aldehyde dehydrogenase family protein n=1 Tax=uncultured Hoeflea sp. TaxID=538666 RepID=UPI002605A102|nr:aldehyde dehydrogenase family protein [uncultured Hoeflea sp.]